MRIGNSRMSGVEVHIHMIDFHLGYLKILEFLMLVHVLERNHVDAAHELTFAVIREKRAGWQCGRIDIKRSHTGDKVRQGNKGAHFLVVAAGW